MNKNWIVWSAAVLILGALAAWYYTSNRASDSNDQSASIPGQPGALPVTPRDAFNGGYPLKDTSVLKLPAGAKVAIYEFEDLECPACAHAYPIVHATAEQYKVPLLRHDYPWSFHIWSLDAAITARYLQDKVSAQLADDFRRDVFANQNRIASKDDLVAYTRTWFQSHHQTLPMVVDASGSCRNEVEADHALGDRLGVASTPCIIVVTQDGFVPVAYANIGQLNQIVSEAVTHAGSSPAAALAMPMHFATRTALRS